MPGRYYGIHSLIFQEQHMAYYSLNSSLSNIVAQYVSESESIISILTIVTKLG